MKDKKLRRKIRIRSKIQGTRERPRLSVFRSNKYIYAQLIDDEKGETIVGISGKADKKGSKVEKSNDLGLSLAKLALSKKIKTAVFDRGSYAYHGRVKAVAEGAREGGLKF
ncbi:MAG: 50S ribosomal protein L18 [Candidatus Levybacteria bacterium RIFCSPLOWO2_01_FULL_38_13]|nr:MAG: 50S ribosomal protein L18 [Candidatus Levybacteria bacterium RIFCSPHIGHO2_01_FULL_41_15]OGH34764.1 MAG: 50S ribosomal protein L18 [Candidatus Levybacteria bacterium RIFCSPLOWO2_01_FULL_38_13]